MLPQAIMLPQVIQQQVLAQEFDLPRDVVRLKQIQNRLPGCGLATAGFPNQSEYFSLADGKGDAVHCSNDLLDRSAEPLQETAAQRKVYFQFFHPQDLRRHRFPSGR